MISLDSTYRRARAQDGFSLVVVLAVMVIVGMLVVGGLTATDTDLHLSSSSASHTQAYYAALAGVQEYDYKLQNEPDVWEKCEGLSGEAEGAHYEVKILVAETAPTGTTACNPSSPFKTAIQSKGRYVNTFQVESTACSRGTGGKLSSCQSPSASVQVRHVVATFGVTGFLDFAYFTQYEDEDYTLSGNTQAECEQYYSVRSKNGSRCTEIEFAPEDGVHGPMHTDDAANVCGSVEFGRKEYNGVKDPDAVEINGGVNLMGGGECSGSPTFNTTTGTYSKGKELKPPESDSSLKLYVEPQNEFEGATRLVLNGSSNTIEVTNKGVTKSLAWPANGLMFVEQQAKGGVCTYDFKQVDADGSNEAPEEEGCGTVYVKGTYSKSLTIAAERELIIDGNLVPSGVTPGELPTGTETLGLIATHFVRVYHPVEENGRSCENAAGYLENPYIYAAILSTSHSFVVDNYDCGKQSQLKDLNVYGAIAQKFRGIVGTVGDTGYLKNYVYDERLATDEPPYFLAPLKAGWKIVRETAPEAG